MKYISSVMADYIKPFIKDTRGNNQALKEKFDPKIDEEKQNMVSGMGDFDYVSFPMLPVHSGLSELDQYTLISNNTRSLMITIDNEIAETYLERKGLDDRLDIYEKTLQQRKKLLEICVEMNKKESMEIEKYLEKNKKMECTINYLEQMVESWQCLIDQFRKIPDESDCV